MRTYTATVTWLEWKRNDYVIKSQVVRGIVAPDIIKASEIALAPFKDRVCPNVSSIWYDV